MRFVSVLSLLLFAIVANAQPYVLEGDKKVKYNHGFAILTVPKADNVIWRVTPDPTKVKQMNGNIIFAGIPGTTYRIEVSVITQVIDFEKKTASLKIDNLSDEVVFDGPPVPVIPPTPKPNPGPGPNPEPAPSDLAARVKAQVALDKVKGATVDALSFAYSSMTEANMVGKATPIAVFRQIRTVIAATIDDDGADNLRALIDAEVDKLIKGKETSDLDAANKALVKSVIQSVVSALDSSK